MTGMVRNLFHAGRQWLSYFWIGTIWLVSTISCTEKESNGILNSSSRYASCNQILSDNCSEYIGDYCLFGFKFGGDNGYSPAGIRAIGPKTSGGLISYSFQEIGIVSTHRQINIPSESFSSLPDCAKPKIRAALAEWSAAADFEFEERVENSSADIMFFSANISVGGVGYPNFAESPCDQLAGHIILNPGFTTDCDQFYLYVLHEIGHALGLGHAGRQNVMGVSLKGTSISGLQPGDIEGIRQIYGE